MERLIDAAEAQNIPAHLEPVRMPSGMYLTVHRPHVDIIWADALRDLQRLRAATEAWRREADRLRSEVDDLRRQIVEILEPQTDDYLVDEGTTEEWR